MANYGLALALGGLLLTAGAQAKDPAGDAVLPTQQRQASGQEGGGGALQVGGALAADPTTVQVGLRLFGLAPDAAQPPPPVGPAAAQTPPPATPPAGAADPVPGSGAGRVGGAKAPVPASQAAPPAAPAAPRPVAGRPPAPPANPPAVQTRFTPNPTISLEVRGRILAQISPQQAQVRQNIAAGLPWQEFDALLRRYGYSSTDYADVLTAYYIICWEVVTGGDAAREYAGIAAVRRGVAAALAGNPGFLRMTEAQRQATAETVSFFSVLVATANNGFRAQGNAQGVMALRQQVATILRNQGVEIGAYRLTPAGFNRG